MRVVVLRVDGVATIQDGGRRGRMHEGIPPGGALVPPLLHRANAALGNAIDAPAIEHAGKVVLRAETPARIFAGGHVIDLRAHESATIPAPLLRVDYIGMEGGLDATPFLGGRGALLTLGHGRILAGRHLGAAGPARGSSGPRRPPDDLGWRDPARPIPLAFGPDPIPSGLRDTLLGASFRVSPTSDRAGTRLDGPALPFDAEPAATSQPMVAGGVQLTPSGLIVLGPDHPTTGGYPLVAVVPRAAQARIFALRPGAALRFVAA